MQQQTSSLLGFLAWWQNALLRPWQPQKPPLSVLSFAQEGWQQVSSQGDASLVNLSALDAQAAYLYAPSLNVIQTRIPNDSKHLTTEGLLEKLFPFQSEELFFAKHENQLFAVQRSDVAELTSQLENAGIQLEGIAFDCGAQAKGQFCFSNNQLASANQGLSLMPLAAALLVASLLMACSIYAFNHCSQSSKQAGILSEIELLKSQHANTLSRAPSVGLTAELGEVNVRGAADIASVFEQVAAALPINAEIDQLIINEQELVLDARSDNAAAFKAALNNLDVLSASEFITAISSGTQSEEERFRLKSSLSNLDNKTLENQSTHVE